MSRVILITDWLMPMLFISQRAGQMGQLPHGPVVDCQTHGKEWKHTWYSTPVLHRQMSSSRSSGTGLSVSDQTTHTEQRQGKCVELEQDPLGIEYEWLIGGRLFSILVIKYFYHRWRITPQVVLPVSIQATLHLLFRCFDLLWTFCC